MNNNVNNGPESPNKNSNNMNNDFNNSFNPFGSIEKNQNIQKSTNNDFNNKFNPFDSNNSKLEINNQPKDNYNNPNNSIQNNINNDSNNSKLGINNQPKDNYNNPNNSIQNNINNDSNNSKLEINNQPRDNYNNPNNSIQNNINNDSNNSKLEINNQPRDTNSGYELIPNKQNKNTNFITFSAMAFIIILVLILGSLLLNINKPIIVFETAIGTIKKEFNSITQNFIENNTINANTINSKNEINIKTNLKDLKEIENYKFKINYDIDFKQKLANVNMSLNNKKESLINLNTYLTKEKIVLDLHDLFSKNIYKNLTKEEQEKINLLFDNKQYINEDAIKLINKYLTYLENSLEEDFFKNGTEKIVIDGKEIKAKTNILKLDVENMTIIRNNFIDQILEDDEFISIIIKYLDKTKEEIIQELKEEKNKKFEFNNIIEDNKKFAAHLEANTILNGIENYCQAEELKSIMDHQYVNICKNGVTIDETKKMVNLHNNKILKIDYNKKINILEIESNGYKFEYKDGEMVYVNDNSNDIYYTITLYTKGKNLIAIKLKNEKEELINLTNSNDIIKITFPNNKNNILIKYEKNSNNKIITLQANDENNIPETLKINVQSKKFNKYLSDYNINAYFESENKKILELQYIINNIDNNKSEQNIALKINQDNDNIEFYINSNIELNKEFEDLNINNKNLVEYNNLTKSDLNKIKYNYAKAVEGTIFNAYVS